MYLPLFPECLIFNCRTPRVTARLAKLVSLSVTARWAEDPWFDWFELSHFFLDWVSPSQMSCTRSECRISGKGLLSLIFLLPVLMQCYSFSSKPALCCGCGMILSSSCMRQKIIALKYSLTEILPIWFHVSSKREHNQAAKTGGNLPLSTSWKRWKRRSALGGD